jgi:hypothetical protein
MLRQIVLAELDRGGYPFPPEFVESIIQSESGAIVGKVNLKSGASGLMQIMPIALREYNRRSGDRLKMRDMRSTDRPGAILQVRVGLHILGIYWRGAYKYMADRLRVVQLPDLAKIAQLFYVAGPNAAKKRLKVLRSPTFAAFAKRYPSYVSLPYIRKIWARSQAANAQWSDRQIDRWVRGDVQDGGASDEPLIAALDPRKGIAIAMAVVALASYYLKRS